MSTHRPYPDWYAKQYHYLCLFVVMVSLCSMLSVPAQASDTETATQHERPRIGLVLGGGGARGAAHVGVLKVLEEMRIPVDYIVGTSMGAIVGGLHASGMDAAEIENLVLTMDWNDLFTDYPTRAERSFRRKRDDDLYTFNARLGYNDSGLQFPLAYVSGQKFDLVLNRLTLPVYRVEHFDDLPIPFRAVAADLETGKEVILADGRLSRAIRASMAVPAAFTPVEIDGRLLVDGGLVNNVPVSVARDLGADVLIVVDVGSGLSGREDIKDALDVSGQLANFLFSLNTEQQLASLEEKDILIKPPLGDIGGGKFDKADEAISTGVEGAQQVLDLLRRYSLDPEAYAAHVAARKGRVPGIPVIDYIRIENQTHLDDNVIYERITAQPGQPLDLEQLEKDISTIYGLQIFESVTYKLEQNDGRVGLVVSVIENSWGPGYFQFGLASANTFDGESITNIGLTYTLTEINSLNAEWRSGIQLGDEPGLFTEIYQPLDPSSRYFISTKFFARSRNINLFNDDGQQLARYFLEEGGIELGLGRDFGTWGEGRFGYRRSTGDAELKVGPDLPDIDTDIGEWFVRLAADRLDNLYFPREGLFGRFEYISARESNGARRDYNQLLGSYVQAVSFGQNSFIGRFAFATTEDDNAPLEGLFQLGGLFRLSGLQEDQLSGQHVMQVNAVYMRRLTTTGFLDLFESYAGLSLEAGNVWQAADDISSDDLINSASLFVGFDTPVGPLYLADGRTDTQQESFYLYLGPRFNF